MGSATKRLRKSNKQGLQQAMRGATQALQVLQDSEMEKLPEILRVLEDQTERASQLADALVQDNEDLLQRLEALETKVESLHSEMQTIHKRLNDICGTECLP